MKNSEKQSKAALKAELKALNREEKRLSKVRIPKSTPRTVFEVTAIGLAKRASGKYKNRWHE